VVTKGRSEVLDVGRTTRTIPPALWRALVVRDGGCVVEGCDRPVGWCEVHHQVPWSQGGPTNLENCELRCWRHHRAVHEGGHDPPRR
jgi:HNH endonuclease